MKFSLFRLSSRVIIGFSLAIALSASSTLPNAQAQTRRNAAAKGAKTPAAPTEQTRDQNIYMAQINPVIGDIEHNLALIEAEYRKAVASGADVFMTPEMAIVGYPPRDLLRNEELIPRVDFALARLKKLSKELRTPDGRAVTLVVGHPALNKQARGKRLRNQTTVFDDGQVTHEHYKRLLPTYDIFDEVRYFEAGTTTKSFEKNGVVYAILNCEEGWFFDPQQGRLIYKKNPADDIKKLSDAAHQAGKKFMILDTSASPWVRGKPPVREDLHADVMRLTGADGLVYTNMWGGNDSILFDGHSFVMAKDGKLLGRMAAFGDSAGMVTVPVAKGAEISLANPQAFVTALTSDAAQTRKALVMGLRDYFRKTGQKKAIVGNSGGIDCALVLSLLAEAIGNENVISVSMPSDHSSEHSKKDAADLAERLRIEHRVEPIGKHYKALVKQLGIKDDIADQNVQARLRGNILQNLGNEVKAVVVGTGNKAEYFQGYATIHGDVMALNPIIGLKKALVYEASRQGNTDGVAIALGKKVLNKKTGAFSWEYEKASDGKALKREVAMQTIPQTTIVKPPSAELKPGQKDSDDLPVYDILDKMVDDVIVDDMGPKKFLEKWGKKENWADAPQDFDRWQTNNQAGLKKLLNRFEWTEIKRLLSAVSMKVSPRDFGPGWQQVIAKRYYQKGQNAEFDLPGQAPVDKTLPAPIEIRPEAVEIVQKLNEKFRSSDRYIPADVLRRQAVRAINPQPGQGPNLMVQFMGLSRGDVIKALQTLPNIDKGIAENLIKLHQIQQLCVNGCDFSDERSAVPGLSQKELDELVKPFAEPAAMPGDPTARRRLLDGKGAGYYDYAIDRAEKTSVVQLTDNDLYNFKTAADYWGNGLDSRYEVTASLFSRGQKDRPFLISLGQEEVNDMLKNLVITEEEIQYVRQEPQFKDVPEGYFEFLRNFKWTGTVRGTPPGTIVYGDEPIMEFTGSPVQVQIIETLVIPKINKMMNFATMSERITRVAGGRVYVEGGSRRGIDGYSSGKAAVIAGAAGTSNVKTAMIHGLKAYGSQNHFSIMMFDTEAHAQAGFLRFFPDSTLLSDTNGPEISVRESILAYGPDLKLIRLDSNLPGVTKLETAQWARKILDDLGYHHTKIIYSDGIDEFELESLNKNKAPIDIVNVGTAAAAPSTTHMNVVYKLSELREKASGRVWDPVKKALGKLSLPGAHSLWRTYDKKGRSGRGFIAELDEAGPRNAKKIWIDYMIDGVDVFKRSTIPEMQTYIREQIKKLPLDQLPLTAKKVDKYFDISPRLQARLASAVARTTGEQAPHMVLVFPGSFSPATDSHIKMMLGMKTLLEKRHPGIEIVIIPSGDRTNNGKQHEYTAKQRVAILERMLGGKAAMKAASIRIDTVEIDSAKNGKVLYTADTMRELEKQYAGGEKGTEFTLAFGQDLLNGPKENNLIRNFKEAAALFDKYNFFFHTRKGGTAEIKIDHTRGADFIRLLPEEVQPYFVSDQGSAVVALNTKTNKTVRIGSVGAGDLSSSQIRERAHAVDTVYMDVDTLLTFWKGMHGTPDGPLAVGTADTAAGAAKMKRLGFADPKGKIITIRDTHHDLEVAYAAGEHNNPEFDPKGMNLPPHSRFRTKGPVGDGSIPESKVFARENQHTVPHLRQRGNKLILAPYDINGAADQIRDPNVETVVEKSGPGVNPRTREPDGSFGAGNNPRFKQVLDQIGAKRYVLWGVCTDICVDRTLLDTIKIVREKTPGAEFIVIRDAIEGLDPKNTADFTREWQEMHGVKLMTAEEYVAQYRPELKPILALSPDLTGKKARQAVMKCLKQSIAQ